jgi:tRNA 2-thiouridine synthesizing protein A
MTLLDTTGLKCPLPVLKAKKALKALPAGARIEIHATDPGAPADFRAFCEATGDTLERADQAGDRFVFVIRKAGE